MSNDSDYKNVSRQKYDDLKNKAQQWHKKFLNIKEERDTFLDKIEELEDKIEKFVDNEEVIAEMTESNEKINKELDTLKKERKMFMKNLSEKYKDTISNLEKEILIKDGQIQRLDDQRKDLHERYIDLRDENKELNRYVRSLTMPSINIQSKKDA